MVGDLVHAALFNWGIVRIECKQIGSLYTHEILMSRLFFKEKNVQLAKNSSLKFCNNTCNVIVFLDILQQAM